MEAKVRVSCAWCIPIRSLKEEEGNPWGWGYIVRDGRDRESSVSSSLFSELLLFSLLYQGSEGEPVFHPNSQMSKLRPKEDGTINGVGEYKIGQTWGTARILQICQWQLSLYCLMSYQCLPVVTTHWLPMSLTRPGALAQLSSVDGLGELGYLVILIFHVYSHKLWTPQDASILRLQGDLEGKGNWSPALSCLLASVPHSVIPVVGTLLFPPGPGPLLPLESQNLDPQQRCFELLCLSLLIGQSGLHPSLRVVVAGGRKQAKELGARVRHSGFQPVGYDPHRGCISISYMSYILTL